VLEGNSNIYPGAGQVQPERGGFLAAGAASWDVRTLVRAELASLVNVLALEASPGLHCNEKRGGFTSNRSQFADGLAGR
jgi:hypothetical protein